MRKLADAPSLSLRSSARVRTDLGRPLLLAALGAPLLLIAMVGWAIVTPISGAIITSGQAVAPGQNRKLQHLDGGIVTHIYSRNGDYVSAGQVLVALDPLPLRTNLGILHTRMAEALALQARLLAEQRDLTAPGSAVPLDMAAIAATPAASYLDPDESGEAELALVVAGQEQIRTARTALRASQSAQLIERVAQMEGQREGLDGLITSTTAQLGFAEEELRNLEALIAKGLTARPRLLEAQAGRANLQGQLARYRSDRAGFANSIRDAQLELARSDSEFRERVATDLRATTGQIEELVQQIVTYRARLERVQLRAPVDGLVHEMTATTLGGVIAPGETVAEIVPVSEGVEFDVRLDPGSIDQVHPGQEARLKFPAFDARTTPEIRGTVAGISPNTIEDERSGTSFYRVRIEVTPAELARLPEAPVPGMPVEAYLTTGERSALSWLLKPATDHMTRAFREN
ncbi:HlyD family type I secretion periplasmic adaptor subunit [Frigidibacter mobilis]|uniref:Membrane fusion protein (MFP) family protein n=1 Tax=Frigidibacter mobilis TaxID=1335048 RepID=A0A161GZR4_9RHOB|nr:HlyD family type I secretion periplasmic adaptor subunit [Frigidibacter mobilis]AMY71159.1 ABC transporter, membrane spanning protein [Frigidibacter mobilis]